MKILVTGAKGQLGFKIQELLSKKYELILTDSCSMDITDKLKVHKVIKSERPNVIIHAAAYTKVDDAEENEALCRKINALGTKNIAEVAKEIDATLIYISTDYIFDGKRKFRDKCQFGYIEADIANPLSVYGRTKLEGEKFIQNICKKYYIIRSAWIFGELPEEYKGGNFIETMLRLAKEKDSLRVVNDQIGSPTYTKDLVEVIEKIIKFKIPYDIYHFSGEGECSWYDFAKEIFRQTKVDINIHSIESSEYPQKAKRPAYSYLDKSKIEKALKIKVRTWKAMLGDYLE